MSDHSSGPWIAKNNYKNCDLESTLSGTLLNTSCVSKNQDNKLDLWKRFLSWNMVPFWLENPTPFGGGGGRRVRGESWKLILYCIFSAAARPLKLYFFAWPPMIPTNAAPILLCSTGWAFGLVSKFHCGDLYKWDSPTAGHLQHFFKTTVTNVQSLELMEPLIPYLPVYNARPVYNTHPDFWPLYSKKKRFQDKHQELKLPFFHLINKSWEFINDMFTTNYKYRTHRALVFNTWSPYS